VDACSSKVCCSCYKSSVIGFCKRGGDGDCQGQEDKLDHVCKMDELRATKETKRVYGS
jgi:hypothetical protein